MIDFSWLQDLTRLPERSFRPLHSYPGFISSVNNNEFPLCIYTMDTKRGSAFIDTAIDRIVNHFMQPASRDDG